jgi:hypothetical protein
MEKQLNTKGGKNTFKFLSFNDQIQNIKINTLTLSDYDCFFLHEYELLLDLELSVNYREFVGKISNLVGSLNEILYYKNEIFQLMVEYIKKSPIIIKLVSAICRDLQGEIVENFMILLPEIVDLIPNLDAINLQIYIENIAIIFKVLSKHLDCKSVFDVMKPLFGSLLHIRVFTSQSFSFLLRKAKALEQDIIFEHMITSLNSKNPFLSNEILDGNNDVLDDVNDNDMVDETILDDVNNNDMLDGILDDDDNNDMLDDGILYEKIQKNSIVNDDYCKGIALIFYETLKQLNNQFYSKSSILFERILRISFNNINHNTENLLHNLFILLGHYGTADSMQDLIKACISFKDKSIKFISIWVGLRNGNRIKSMLILTRSQ